MFTPDTFDSSRLNWTAAAEFVAAVAITDVDFLGRLLGTTELTRQQFGLALVLVVGLLVVWELGKWIARHRSSEEATAVDRDGPSAGSSSRAATAGSVS